MNTTTTYRLLDAVCNPSNLASAYHRYAHYRGLWEPGTSMWRVARAPVGPMLELADRIRSGRYKPWPPLTFNIPKADGGHRCLHVYALRDRVAQRAVFQVLHTCTDPAMSAFSFGYRAGRGVTHALRAVRDWLDTGHDWVLDADIERCFDSIPRRRLLAEVDARLHDPKASRLILEMMGWHSSDLLDGIGIPQGAVLSPWLCNCYLWQLDDRLEDARLPMVRYADDFVVLALARHLADQARVLCQETLRAMGLRLNSGKTRVLHASTTQLTFLGQSMMSRLRLPYIAKHVEEEPSCS